MKKKIAASLCLIICLCACIGCSKEYWGVYKQQGNGINISSFYIELSRNVCEYYILGNNETKEDAKNKPKDDGVYCKGTYKVDGKKITLYFTQFGPDGQPFEWTGTILDNGNISLPIGDGGVRIFKRQ